MFSISTQSYGFELTFNGAMNEDEFNRLHGQSLAAMQSAPSLFGVLIDMREAGAASLKADAQRILAEVKSVYRKAGMARCCVIVKSATEAMQLQRIAMASGMDRFERHLNATAHPDWEKEAVSWLSETSAG